MTTIQEIVDSNRFLYPSLFTSFIQTNKEIIPSKLIQERISDNQCSVPIIIQNMNDNEPIFFADKKKERIKFTLNFLKNKPEYENLYKYLVNPDTKLLGISTNQLYIRKAIASSVNKKGYCPPQLKNKNTGWMLLIDIQNKIIGFIVLDFI
jgi:hypothetical protein